MSKPKLKTEKVEYLAVSYNELERFATKIYKFKNRYSFVAAQECDNDSEHSFSVTGEIDESDEETAEAIREGQAPEYYQNQLLLDLLCADGHIAKGDYLVSVCW